MFKIYDGREHFYQWDRDRMLIVEDRSIAEVHFCNRTRDCALSCICFELEDKWVVDVPSICLQESYRLKVYGYSADKYTVVSECFDIEARNKPEDYVYTEEEIACWQELDERITALEKNPVSDMVLFNAIDNYFDTNPIVGKAGTGESGEIFNDYVNSVASGRYSHAEGFDAHAIGDYSHAEGFHTQAVGSGSHAEGHNTSAPGTASHAEGMGTTAWGNGQHVQGRYSVGDMENKYAHIVGNGYYSAESGAYQRSNAHTLDWEGNAWFAGNVRVGGTCWDDATELGGAPDLTGYATEEYVNTAISNIEVGGGIEIVNATGDETIELDKTYEEIMVMIDAGKVVVINYDGNLYHQFSDSPNFRYVGDMENRVISFNKRDYSVRYSENIIPAYEDVGTIVEEMLEDRNYQTAEQVEAAINAAKPDLTGYATESWVEGKGYLTQHQDLTGYAKTTDIPDVSAYQTAEQVNAAIANYVGVIENGTY